MSAIDKVRETGPFPGFYDPLLAKALLELDERLKAVEAKLNPPPLADGLIWRESTFHGFVGLGDEQADKEQG